MAEGAAGKGDQDELLLLRLVVALERIADAVNPAAGEVAPPKTPRPKVTAKAVEDVERALRRRGLA